MRQPYSEDLRERALARADAGESVRAIAAALRISPTCISKWKTRRPETGSLLPGKIGGHKKRVLTGWLRQRTASGPFTTRKLVAELAARGVKTDWRMLQRMERLDAHARYYPFNRYPRMGAGQNLGPLV